MIPQVINFEFVQRVRMKTVRVSIVIFFAGCVALPPLARASDSVSAVRAAGEEPAFIQKIDPAFQGFWILDLEKSEFGGRPKPTMGFVNWGEHGWTFALVTANGRLYADGVSTDRGCALIGDFANYSCEVAVVTPRHVRFTLMQGTTIRQIGEIELLENGTTQTTHRVIPSEGAAFTQTTIWGKQVRK